MDIELSVTQERLDDIPVIFAMARKLGLPEIVEKHLGRHGNHEGMGYGWLVTTWIAYILAEGGSSEVGGGGLGAEATDAAGHADG